MNSDVAVLFVIRDQFWDIITKECSSLTELLISEDFSFRFIY